MVSGGLGIAIIVWDIAESKIIEISQLDIVNFVLFSKN